MKNVMKISMLILFLLLGLAACGAPNNQTSQTDITASIPTSIPTSAGTKIDATPITSQKLATSTMDAGAIIEAFGAHRNLPMVQGSGIVKKVLKDDTKGSKHQKILLKVSDNITILIAHNIDLAPRVADVKAGDAVAYKGEYIYTPKGGTVHWTHKDPRNHHEAGYLKHNGNTYE